MFGLSSTELLVILVFGVVGIPVGIGLLFLVIDMTKNSDKYDDPM